MHERLLVLKEKLENLHSKLEQITFPQKSFINLGAYTHPFLGDEDIVGLPQKLAEKVGLLDKFIPNEDEVVYIDNIIVSLDQSPPNIEHLNHSNNSVSAQAINAFFVSMLFISDEINNLFSFDSLKDKNLVPKRIINRLELYESNLEAIEKKTGDIGSKVNAINEAYDAAEGLPTTLKLLRETNEQIQAIKEGSLADRAKIEGFLKAANEAVSTLNDNISNTKKAGEKAATDADKYLQDMMLKAEGYIDKCEEAFRTTTSKGLAGAFEDKAKNLNVSIRYWVGGLLCSLAAGALVGYFRLTALEGYLSNPDTSGLKVFIQVLFSVLSVGAPLWFAWLATKQIGQRFRLAEDYEFKASVSKAYEGYRREAVNLDEAFQQRLFGNALTRLEEPPLRFVEESAHSSPFMEVISSLKFKEFVSKGDDAVDAVLAKAGLKRKEKEKPSESSSNESMASQVDDETLER